MKAGGVRYLLQSKVSKLRVWVKDVMKGEEGDQADIFSNEAPSFWGFSCTHMAISVSVQHDGGSLSYSLIL